MRGTVNISDLTALHELTPALARRLTDYDLHLFPHLRTNDAVAHSIIEAELRRRERFTARLALAVSVGAVCISIATAVFSNLQPNS